MPQTIEQPAREPSLPWMQPSADEVRRAKERAALDELPPTAIRHIDVPFEDVFALAFKLFVAQVIIGVLIGAPLAALVWYAFLR